MNLMVMAEFEIESVSTNKKISLSNSAKTDIICTFYNGFQTSFQRVPHVSQSTHRKPR